MTLRVAVGQPAVTDHAVTGNVAAHAAMVAEAAADLIVFPELSLTGYTFDAGSISPDDTRLDPLVDACRRVGTTALVGAPVGGEPDERFIAMLAVTGRGAAVVYRKMFLGDAERRHFTAGSEPAVVEVGGRRVGTAVCRDTGQPEQAAATAELGIDLYAAGALEHDVDADVQPRRAARIARTHRVHVAVACYAGSTGEGFDRASGGSGIWRPDGSVVSALGSEPGRWIAADLDIGDDPRPITGQ